MHRSRNMARVLGVSASGFLRWVISNRRISKEAMLRRILTIHVVFHGTHGAPRVQAELQRRRRATIEWDRRHRARQCDVESFFATLECGSIDRHRFNLNAEAQIAVCRSIASFYNPLRRHSFIGQLSPAEFKAAIKPTVPQWAR